MILQATGEHRIDLSRSFLIGDKEIDAQCGRIAGVRTIRVQTGPQYDTIDTIADWVAADLAQAAKIIIGVTNE
jgi:D-glycero-D-manno-heptose 1,7-bisphosphate phosphatase